MVSEVTRPPVIVPEARTEADARFTEFVELAKYQRDNVLPQNNDKYTQAYEEAFANNIESNTRFRAFFRDLLNDMPDVEPENVLRRTLKTFQHIEKTNDYNFPRDHAEIANWEHSFDALLNDEEYRDQFYGNIFLPIMSNVSERGVLLKAVALLHNKIKQVRILDMGCSLNDVLTRMVLERAGHPLLAYRHIDVMRRGEGPGNPLDLDVPVTQRVNDWLNIAPLDVGPSVGIDALPFDEDERLQQRALHDSRYMGQLLLERLDTQMHILAEASPPQVSFRSLDAATFDPAVFGQKFDIAYGSTMLYQTPRETRRSIFKNADAVTEDDGLIVYQDFIRTIGSQGGMRFYKRWVPYTYGVWVKDKQQPDLGFQKYFTVYSGRVEKIIPNEAALRRLPAAVELGLARPTEAES